MPLFFALLYLLQACASAQTKKTRKSGSVDKMNIGYVFWARLLVSSMILALRAASGRSNSFQTNLSNGRVLPARPNNTNKKTTRRWLYSFEWWGVGNCSCVALPPASLQSCAPAHPTTQKKTARRRFLYLSGGACAVRTRDHLIKSQMLYQLS